MSLIAWLRVHTIGDLRRVGSRGPGLARGKKIFGLRPAVWQCDWSLTIETEIRQNQPTKNPKHSGVFVLGTDTEVGKTFQAVQLLHAISTWKVGVYKPVASGVSPHQPSDPSLLCEATGGKWPMDRICPQTFAAPLAPPYAAREEGRVVDESLLLGGASWWSDKCDFLVVEGAGGALSPISDSKTVLDVAEQIGFPTIVVAANRLGCVNQTLLTIEAIQNRGLTLVGIVLNTMPAAESGVSDLSRASNAELLRRFVDASIPIVDGIVHLVDSL